MDYLTPLEADYRRFAEVTAGDLSAKVPTCPEWRVEDLVTHVAQVYLHKVACMRLNAQPDPWPPAPTGESPRQLLARAYGELTTEFGRREPSEPAATWYEPDNTVGFWLRRMAQETVIHRIDAELAAGEPSMGIPEDLALDGIDEVLFIFLAWAWSKWPEDFADALSKGDGSVAVAGRWLVSWRSDSIAVTSVVDSSADARVDGTPEAILRWLWGRADDTAVQISGNEAKVAQMRELLRAGTQ